MLFHEEVGLVVGELVDDCEAVAQGEDYFFDTTVGGNFVVEAQDAFGLRIELLAPVHDFAVPQGVVGDYETAIGNMVEHEVVVCTIFALVGIDEHEVECGVKPWQDVACVAYVQRYFAALRRSGEVAADEVFKLVVYLDGVQFPVVGQTLCKTEG